MKSSVDDIRRRFDGDVERFANLDTGQTSTVDAALVLDLVTETAVSVTPHAAHLLDVGCGAGNYSLKLLQRLPNLDVTLIDLSRPMLDRAAQRVGAATSGQVTPRQGDIRTLDLPPASVDIILAAAVLHHLRDEAEWRAVFAKLYACLRPGGALWIADLITHDNSAVQAVMWRRYGEYLTAFRGEAYRDEVFAYIEREDSPRSLSFQLRLLRDAGFRQVDVLHKHSCFAAFGGVKPDAASNLPA